MDEFKKVNGQYTIQATNIIIDGALLLLGDGSTVDYTTLNINDNVIFLNYLEPGAGVTLGTSGFEIDRGTLPNVSLIWQEANDVFEFRGGDGASGALLNLRTADPVDASDVATKGWVEANAPSADPAGSNTQIQFNNSGAFGASANLTWNGTVLKVGNFDIGSNIIAATNTNGGIELTTNGTGQIYLRAPLRLENEGSDPSSVSGSNMLYAKTPANGGTGLYVNNTTTSGELISKSRAIFYSMIF